eukprot:3890963-Prymnesium_polylepis.1
MSIYVTDPPLLRGNCPNSAPLSEPSLSNMQTPAGKDSEETGTVNHLEQGHIPSRRLPAVNLSVAKDVLPPHDTHPP